MTVENQLQKLKHLPEGFVSKFIEDMIRFVRRDAMITPTKGTKFKTARIFANTGADIDNIAREIDRQILIQLNTYIENNLGDSPKNYLRNNIEYESVLRGNVLEIRF